MAIPPVLVTLGVYVVVIALIFYVILLGQGSRIPGVSAMNRFMTGGCCISFGKCRRKCLGKRGNAMVEAVENYVCRSAHPLLQIFYLTLVWGGVAIFYSECIPVIRRSRHIHENHLVTIPLMVFLPNLFFTLCSFSNPGKITKDNVNTHLKSYPYDNIIFKEKECSTCNIQRPARSKHCSLCHACVARFDHHCAWVNNCIGEYNVKWFVLFLMTTANLCMYGAYLCTLVSIDIVEEKDLFSMRVRTPTGSRPVTWDVVFRWLMMYYAPVITLGLFMLVLAVVLYAFFSYHMYLIARNTSTSETFKWGEAKSDLRYLKKRQTELRKKLEESGDKKGRAKKGKAPAGNDSDGEVADAELLDMKLPAKLINTYNNGILANFYEVILPRSMRKRRKPKKRTH